MDSYAHNKECMHSSTSNEDRNYIYIYIHMIEMSAIPPHGLQVMSDSRIQVHTIRKSCIHIQVTRDRNHLYVPA